MEEKVEINKEKKTDRGGRRGEGDMKRREG